MGRDFIPGQWTGMFTVSVKTPNTKKKKNGEKIEQTSVTQETCQCCYLYVF